MCGNLTFDDALPQAFYDRDVTVVAQELLGRIVIRRGRDGIRAGRIVETEAYLAGGDPASHSFRGRTKKNATMFGAPGVAYVYPIHSRYCVNAVTESRGRASAVLLRAVEPLVGIELMQRRRGTQNLLDLCRGPARLCEAFAIDRRLDGWNITRGARLWISSDCAASCRAIRVTTSARIGVTSAREAPLRYFIDGSPYVSGLKRLHMFKPSGGKKSARR